MNDLTQYAAIHDQIRASDLIFFQGTGLISDLINLFGNGPSHVAIVRVIDRDESGAKVVKIVESTIEGKRNGVQTNRLSERLADYKGRAWWLPLDDSTRRLINWILFYEFIGASEDRVKYDTGGLFEFILRGLPVIGPRVGQTEHANQMVCSGFVTALLESCGVLRGINWSKVTPGDLVSMKLYRSQAQILGTPAQLHDFNIL